MEGVGVHQECDEGPGLFRVPAPIVTPGDIGPDSAEEGACFEQEYGGEEDDKAHVTEPYSRANRYHQTQNTRERHHAKERVGEHHGQYVKRQQGRLQDGHQVRDLRIGPRHGCHEHGEAPDEKSHGKNHGEALPEEADSQGGEPRHEHHHAVAPGKRGVAGNVPAKAQGESQVQKQHKGNEGRCLRYPVRQLLSTGQADAQQHKQNESQRDGEHERHHGPHEPVVEFLGPDFSRSRQNFGGLLLLISAYLFYNMGDLGPVLGPYRTLHKVHHFADEHPAVVVLHYLLRQHFVGVVPFDVTGAVGNRIQFPGVSGGYLLYNVRLLRLAGRAPVLCFYLEGNVLPPVVVEEPAGDYLCGGVIFPMRFSIGF